MDRIHQANRIQSSHDHLIPPAGERPSQTHKQDHGDNIASIHRTPPNRLGRTPGCSGVPINDATHASTGFTPFQLVYGESPQSHLDLFLSEISKASPPTRDKNLLDARNFMTQWRNNLGDARKALQVAQDVQSRLYDRSRKAVLFAVGDRLLISKKHLSIPADRDVPWKLRALYDGDYPVTQVKSRADGSAYAYKLQLPPQMIKNGLHDVFSPDKLIKFRGESKFPSQQQEEEETGIVDGRT